MAKGSIVVSLRSKGLASINLASFFDFKHHAVAAVTEVCKHAGHVSMIMVNRISLRYTCIAHL